MKEGVELASSDLTKASAAVAVVACTQPATDKAKNRGNNRALDAVPGATDGGQDAASLCLPLLAALLPTSLH